MKRRILGIFFASTGACLALLGTQGQAQTFPSQPVRIISPFSPGSGPDITGRIVADKLSAIWKQPVVMDNRPGANGFIAVGAVKRAAPTGNDLLLAAVGHMSINPGLFKNLPYDPKADFVPVGGLYRTSFFMVVGANSPFRSVTELIAAARAAPGKISYASNQVGGPIHLGGAQVEAATGTKMLHVPFKEILQSYIAVSTGEVDWAMGSLATVGPLLQSGKVRLLAVADTVRSVSQPNVPTFREAGGPVELTAPSWVALFAPKGTPAAAIAVLNQTLNEVLRQPDVVAKFATYDFVPYPVAPATLAAVMAKDTLFYADMIKRTGATSE